jgi:uncharacterized protein YbjT (DUF2867 family)
MKILVVGASGFIGRALCKRLAADGHVLVRGVRHPVAAGDIAIDYSAPRGWADALAGCDAVVNAVGIITERAGLRFADVHDRGPSALFAACAAAGVRRVVQISALGAQDGDTPYFRSKRAADHALMALPIEWQIVRPALVYGADGVSAAMFRMLASMPLVPVPQLGGARFQPVHIDDVCEEIVRLLAPATPARQQVDLVGATRVSYREMLDAYRRAMHFPAPLYLTIPAPLMRCLAAIGSLIPGATLTRHTWRMLCAGSSVDGGAPGRPVRGVGDFIGAGESGLMRQRALASWRGHLLRAVLAVIWIATALVSAFVYPVEASQAMLAQLGLTGKAALTALYGASLLDFVLGIATLAWPRRALWAAQAALIMGYTIAIAIAIPAYLEHPFGPLLKNLPILAILLILYSETEAWTT